MQVWASRPALFLLYWGRRRQAGIKGCPRAWIFSRGSKFWCQLILQEVPVTLLIGEKGKPVLPRWASSRDMGSSERRHLTWCHKSRGLFSTQTLKKYYNDVGRFQRQTRHLQSCLGGYRVCSWPSWKRGRPTFHPLCFCTIWNLCFRASTWRSGLCNDWLWPLAGRSLSAQCSGGWDQGGSL